MFPIIPGYGNVTLTFFLQNRHATRLALTLTGCRSTSYKQDVLKWFRGKRDTQRVSVLRVCGFQESTDFHFAKYRFSFRKVQIFSVSQSTDFRFAKFRFHFVSFRLAKYHFAKYNKPYFPCYSRKLLWWDEIGREVPSEIQRCKNDFDWIIYCVGYFFLFGFVWFGFIWFRFIWFYQLSWQCKLATVKRFESWRFER